MQPVRRWPWIAGAFAVVTLTAVLAQQEAPEDGASREAGGIDLAAALGEAPAEGFARPAQHWRLALPRDHGAHPGTRSETWTLSASLRSGAGEALGLQTTLLRVGLRPPDAEPPPSDWTPRAIWRGHVVILPPGATAATGEERINRAALGLAGHDPAERQVWLDGWSLGYGAGAEGEALTLSVSAGETRLDLRLAPAKPPVAAEGGGGPVNGFALTRLSAEGTLTTPDGETPVSGTAWLDRLWGEVPLPTGPVAWDRLQLQLDDDTELSILRTRRRDGRGAPTLDAFVVEADGESRALDGAAVQMEPVRHWQGGGASGRYPVGWRVRAGALDLTVEPVADDQVHDFLLPLWSGAVRAEGRRDGTPVTGRGTLQLTGYEPR